MAELTKSRPTNLLKNIGVVGTEGYASAQRSLKQLASTADRIGDTAYKYEANRLETEASFDAHHDTIEWKNNFLIEDKDGDFKITEVYEDESEGKLLYTFKTPLSNQMLPTGKIYNTAYNKEREPVFEKALVLAVGDFARQAETQNILNPEKYLTHVSAYIDKISEDLPSRYANTLKNLENDVISRHYNNITSHVARLELEQLNYKRKSNLTQSTNVVMDYISEIGYIEHNGVAAFTIERGEKNEVIINYSGEENITELDAHVSMLNEIIADVEGELTVPTESKTSWINSEFKKLALVQVVNFAKTLEVQGDKSITANNFDNFIKELKLGTNSDNEFVKQIASLVDNDKTAMGGFYELLNSYHLDLVSLSTTDFTQTKMAINNYLINDWIDLYNASQSGNKELFAHKEKAFFLKIELISAAFPQFADTPEKIDFINSKKLDVKSNIMFLGNQNVKEFNSYSSNIASGLISQLLNDNNWNDLDSLIQTYKAWEDNDVLSGMRNSDFLRVRKQYLSRYSQLEAESGVINKKMGWIYQSLEHDGSYPVPNDKTHRDGLSLFFQTKQEDFEKEKQTTISNSPLIVKQGAEVEASELTTATEQRLGKREPINDWNMKLQYFAKYGILDTQTYNQMNNGVYMGADMALSSTRMFMELKHLRDIKGGHVGTQILSSLKSESFMFYELMEEVLQGMPQSQWSTGYEAVQQLIEGTKKDTLDNRNRLTMAQKFGTVVETKNYMTEAISTWGVDIEVDDIYNNVNLYNDIMDMYIVNMGLGTYQPQIAMNDAVVKTVMQKYAKSEFAFDADLGGFKEDERFTLLPPELVYRNANLPLEKWLVPYVQEELVKDIDWEGVGLEFIEEKTKTLKTKKVITTSDYRTSLYEKDKVLEEYSYSINTDPTDPTQKEQLILGKNLFLKVYQAPRGEYPTYQLYYIATESSGYANYGQMVKLTKKDGTDLIIDFTPQYKQATENWQEKFYEEKWEDWLFIKENKKREFKQKVIDTIESFKTY